MGKWTRRGFITAGVVAGGGLLIGVAIRPGNRSTELAKYLARDGESFLHTWVKLDQNNIVTAIVPHSEMGQGVGTALAQMLAEELDADWSLVKYEEAPAVREFANYPIIKGMFVGNTNVPDFVVPTIDGALIRTAKALDLQITGGSSSIRMTGEFGMRVAGAAVKEMLRDAAATKWQVPVDEIKTENSHLIHVKSGRQIPYSDVAQAVSNMVPPASPKLKSADDFKIIGKSVARFDLPSKVDGTALFAIDVKLPDMLYATVQRAPSFTGQIETITDEVSRSIKGVVDIVRLPSTTVSSALGSFSFADSVAVVADSFWTAKKGMDLLDVRWESTKHSQVSSNVIFNQFERDIDEALEREIDVSEGDTAGSLMDADIVIEADYRVPYLAHTCMEPLNATAKVIDGYCEIWVGCQSPLSFRKSVADALGFELEKVTLHNCLMGGGFGRKSRPDYAIQAAQIALKVGRPVQLIWTREEDVRQDFYRPAILSKFRGGLDTKGNLAAWHNTYVDKHEPHEAAQIPYKVPSMDIGHVSSPTHIPFGAWRSVAHSHHGFFTESFIDEVAVAAGQDPYEYRLDRLKHLPRQFAVLKKAALMANWAKELPKGRGRGISLQTSFGSIVAEVVEVTVNEGKLSIDRVVAVVDPGYAISPDGMKAQIESGIIYGLSAALNGEITIENGAVKQSNFHDYSCVRMKDSPAIETYIINSGEALGGAGEPGTPPIAAALTNAIYDATGNRIRQLPVPDIIL